MVGFSVEEHSSNESLLSDRLQTEMKAKTYFHLARGCMTSKLYLDSTLETEHYWRYVEATMAIHQIHVRRIYIWERKLPAVIHQYA